MGKTPTLNLKITRSSRKNYASQKVNRLIIVKDNDKHEKLFDIYNHLSETP